MDKKSLINELGRSSILAVFEAASKMFDEEGYLEEVEGEEESYDDLYSFMEDPDDLDCYHNTNFEGYPILEGFDAFDVDPEDFVQGGRMGIPRGQLMVQSPIDGMIKPSPIYSTLFVLDEV